MGEVLSNLNKANTVTNPNLGSMKTAQELLDEHRASQGFGPTPANSTPGSGSTPSTDHPAPAGGMVNPPTSLPSPIQIDDGIADPLDAEELIAARKGRSRFGSGVQLEY